MDRFRYDINVELEEIKSPLPPRRVEISSEPISEPEVKLDIPEERLNKSPEPETKTKPGNKFASLKPKWIIIGIVGILVLIGVIGLILKLIGGNKTKTQEITLNYVSLWEDPTVMNTIISDFESKNPGIKINYKRDQRVDYRTRITAKLNKTGNGGTDDIDVFRFHNTWVPMMKDYLEPVPSEMVNSIGLENDFLDVYKNDLKVGNKWLSIPIMYDGLALFYNRTLLEEAKIEVPKGWWELQKAAEKLTVKDEDGNIKVAGAGMGIANGNVDHWSDILGLMLKQNGIDFDKNTNTDKNLEDALKYYVSFSKSKNKVWDETLPNTTALFAAGKLAFYFGPSWRVFDFNNLNKGLNYGITTVPQLPISGDVTAENPELTDIHWASYWTEGVNNKSKHKAEAWKFLQYLSSAEVLEKMYTAQSQLRTFGEIYPRKSMSEKLKSNEKVWPFLSVANKATSWYLASETGDDGVNTKMQEYFTDAINKLPEFGDSTEVMTTLKNGISQLQQRYSLNK